MTAFGPVAALPVASVPVAGSVGTVSLAISVVGASPVALGAGVVDIGVNVYGFPVPVYTTDVIERLFMSGDDLVSIFCSMNIPDSDDVVAVVPVSYDDVIADVVICCEGGD